MNFKTVILIFIVPLLSQILSAQSFQGTWKIDKLITTPETKEYILYPQDKDFRENYGNSITLENNIFTTSYSAPCGNDCFTSSTGKFEMTDENHIRFIIDKVSYRGCQNVKEEPNFPLDAGLFYIDRHDNKIYLIKSNGNILQDKKNMEYSQLISSKYEESKKFENILRWQQTDFTSEKKDGEVVDFFVLKNNISSCEILYSKDIDYNLSIILLKVNNSFRYLFCNKSYLENYMKKVNQIALFDDDTLETIHHSIEETDHNKNFQINNIEDNENGFRKVITTFKENGKLVKVRIKKIYTSGTVITDLYIQNDDPYYIKTTHDIIQNQKNLISVKAFYITRKNMFISRELVREGMPISQSAFYDAMKDFETILAAQNKIQ